MSKFILENNKSILGKEVVDRAKEKKKRGKEKMKKNRIKKRKKNKESNLTKKKIQGF